MPEITLRPLTADSLQLVEPWFDNPEVNLRLGGRDWPARSLRLMQQVAKGESCDESVTGRFVWLAHEGSTPIGLVDIEIYDRLKAGFAFVIDPQRWNRGYGRALIRSLLARPELAEVRTFEGGAEPDNVASIRCLEQVGFSRISDAPDQEGMLNFSYAR